MMPAPRAAYIVLVVGGMCMVAVGAARAHRSTVAPLPYIRSAQLTPEWLTDAEAASPTMHHIGAFRMTDQHGQTITEQSLRGRITVAQFFFTKCGDLCPTTTTNLQRLLNAVGDSALQVLSYSVTPTRDSVAELRDYAAMRGIRDPRWHLLTGGDSAVARLARDSYFVRLGDGATYGVTSIAHTETVVLIDEQGRIRGFYAGTLPLEMHRLQDDATTLLRTLGHR